MKKSKFKIVLSVVLTSLFLLSGCGDADDNNSLTSADTNTATTDLEKQGKVLYQGVDFTIAIPEQWEVITKEDMTANFPQEVVVAFRNNVKNEIFTANITIAIQDIPEQISADDFGKNSVKKQKEYILDFKDLRSSKQDLVYKDETISTYFIQSEGKKSGADPLVKFAQLFIVNELKAYTITAAYLPNEDENVVNAINEMINSVALK